MEEVASVLTLGIERTVEFMIFASEIQIQTNLFCWACKKCTQWRKGGGFLENRKAIQGTVIKSWGDTVAMMRSFRSAYCIHSVDILGELKCETNAI